MAIYKTIIGRAESVDFPARSLAGVPAKTDTGAFYSSIHAESIEEVQKPNGKKVLKFNLLAGHPSYPKGKKIEVPNYTTKVIQNSFGESQQRYVVAFKVKIANRVIRTEFTLADRSMKLFPILLGRKLLNKKFVVDTDIAHVDRRLLKEKLKDWLQRDDLKDD